MAGILRREKFSTTAAFSFQDLDRKAAAMLEQARAQAKQIVAEAEALGRRRAAEVERQAFPRGLEEGRKQGFEQAHREGLETALRAGRADLAELGQTVGAALRAFEQDKRRLLALAESGVLELALAIARRVCRHDAGSSSAAARDNARALLEMVRHEHDLVLHFNPAECETLRAALPELAAAVGGLGHVEIVADPDVQRGGCVLHTRHGTIDAKLETQLDRVAEALVARTTETEC